MKELIEIQGALKAPKNQKNQHQGYMYRSCEDILEAAKPLCHKHNCLLTLSDEIVMLGDRFYVKATATIVKVTDDIDNKINAIVTVSAFAREQPKKMNSAGNKEIMDHSQLTGSASSYARKYALNGLFCIDDTKDADTMDNSHTAQDKPKQIKQADSKQRSYLKDYLAKFQDKKDVKAIDYINEALVNPNLTEIEAKTIINHCKTKLGE